MKKNRQRTVSGQETRSEARDAIGVLAVDVRLTMTGLTYSVYGNAFEHLVEFDSRETTGKFTSGRGRLGITDLSLNLDKTRVILLGDSGLNQEAFVTYAEKIKDFEQRKMDAAYF
jgi:hypothetical protein